MRLHETFYRELMDDYDQTRQRNFREGVERKDMIYRQIPRIREIDETIAHLRVEEAKARLFHQEVPDEADLLRSLRVEKRTLLTEQHFPADYLDPIYTCTHCRDTGYAGDRKCTCFEGKIRDHLLEQSNLAPYRHDTFAAFRMDYYSHQTPEGGQAGSGMAGNGKAGSEKNGNRKPSPYENMLHIREQSHKFIENFGRGENLLIHGHTGVGKTFLTHCIGNELLDRGQQVLYLTAQQLFSKLADYTFRRNEYEGETLEDILDVDLLIIDDLGTEANNAFVNAQLFTCINERILKQRSTIISTNLSLQKISEAYSERISSRMIESYTIFSIYGDDIRIRKAFS